MDELEAGELFTDGFLLRLRERGGEKGREKWRKLVGKRRPDLDRWI